VLLVRGVPNPDAIEYLHALCRRCHWAKTGDQARKVK
jgi:hypothetical protein